MGCFSNTVTTGFDQRPTNWTTIVSVPNVFVGSGAADAGAILNAFRVFNTNDIVAEFRAVPESDTTTQDSFCFQLNLASGQSRPLSLAGCMRIPGGPQTILFQVRITGGSGNICFQSGAGRTGVILT